MRDYYDIVSYYSFQEVEKLNCVNKLSIFKNYSI